MDTTRNATRTLFHHRLRRAHLAAALLPALLLVAAGCDNDQADPTESGQAMLSIGTIPDDVACIRVSVTGEFRQVVKDYAVTPGTTLVESLSGLPVGQDVFSANAYVQVCDSVTGSTAPMWLSEEKTVSIKQGKSSSVTLTLYKNGRAKVTVEFADQEDGGTDAGNPAGGNVDAGT
jgi:hypothetical protein